jgi:ABC-type Fe3+ transport system substrate-binding protein
LKRTGAIAFFLLLLLALPRLGGADSQKDWEELLSRAKREGKVVVKGPPDPVVRQELPAKFNARFGIVLEYIGARSSETAAKLRSERQAGLYTLDVVLGGAETMSTVLYPEGMLDPLRPALILPEVVDPSKWKAGKLWFIDPEERYIFRLFNDLTAILYLNTAHVKPGEIKTFRDLLDPKWKGKIAAYDPTVPGTGSSTAAFLHALFGEEFVKRLYVDQQPVISRDARQLTDWLARGTYPIALDAREEQVDRLRKEGIPLLTVTQLADAPGAVSGRSGLVALINKAPHPNAAKLFINWIASKEGLDVYARSQLASTTRNDIDESHLSPESVPKPGVRYFDNYDWEVTVKGKPYISKRLRELMKR